MKYCVYNKLSKSGHKKQGENMLNVLELTDQFFENLKAEDEVELHGGDGTINNFINRCIEYPHITVIKSGTGNDLSRDLKAEYQSVAIFAANDYKYLNGFDVGFGALVCKLVEEDKSKNKLSYFKNVYLGLKSTNLLNAKVMIDDEVINTTNSFLIAVQNSKYFGGGMRITPAANITKPSVEVCIIGNAKRRTVAAIFPTVFTASHTKFKKYVTIKTGSKIAIELDEPYIAECDGEVQKATSKYTIEHVGFVNMRLG